MTDEYFMMQALKEAKKAFEDEEIPIGAVVVVNERIIARGHNMTERLKDPTAHVLGAAVSWLLAGSEPTSIVRRAD
jgi:tRNA(Arg) A34 adenosine deaminase TadA